MSPASLAWLPLAILVLACSAPAGAFTLPFATSPEQPPVVEEEGPDADYLTTREWRATGREGWFPWPLVHWQRGETEAFTATHPLFSTAQYPEMEDYRTDILWPLIRWRHRAETPAYRHRTTLHAFLAWFSGSGEDERGAFRDQFLFPIYWQGWRDDGDRYLVIFPFVWFANDAKVKVAIFPPRPQRFAAVWPLAGYFENFWNRDRVRFVLWPIYVRSEREEKGHPDRVVTTSIVWPITGFHRGPNVSGWRLWPLFSRVSKEDEFTRAYWLWPLGHYRSEEPSEELPEGRSLTFFFPFYGSWRDHMLRYQLFFPFYGKLEMRGRRSRGYALAIYNEHDRLRSGVREHRLLWFIGRWTSRIPVPEHFADPRTGEPQEQPRTGGGVFPIYVRTQTDTSSRTTVLWPIGHRLVNEYESFTFKRRYILPFHGSQTKQFADGRESHRRFLAPFYRSLRDENGWTYRNWPHLFPYAESDPLDRNWAPLWTVWSREDDERTNAMRVRVLGNLWQNDRFEDGSRRKRLDLFFFNTEREVSPGGEQAHRTRLLFGALEHRGEGGRNQLRLFGKRL